MRAQYDNFHGTWQSREFTVIEQVKKYNGERNSVSEMCSNNDPDPNTKKHRTQDLINL